MKTVILQSGKYDFGGCSAPFVITKETLKNTVNNTKNPIVLTEEFDNRMVIGLVSDFEYIDGKIIATVTLNEPIRNLDEKAVTAGLNYKSNNIVSCGLVEKKWIMKPIEE